MIEFTKQTDLPRMESRWGCYLTSAGLTPVENELNRPLNEFELFAWLGLAYSFTVPDERRRGAVRPAYAMCNYKDHANFKPPSKPEKPGWGWDSDAEYHDFAQAPGDFLAEAFYVFGIEHPHGRYDVIRYRTPYGFHFTSLINGTIEINPDPSIELLEKKQVIPIKIGG